MIDALYERRVWFEHSGHTPWTGEPDRCVDVVVNQVLKGTG